MNNDTVKVIQILTILELPLNQTVTLEIVNSQYKKLAKIYHPDVANSRYRDGAKFKELKVAQEYLLANINYVNRLIASGFSSSSSNSFSRTSNYYEEQKKQDEERRRQEELRKQEEQRKRREEAERKRREEEERRRREEAEIKRKEEEQRNFEKRKNDAIAEIKEVLESIKKDDYFEDDYTIIDGLINAFVKKVNNNQLKTIYSIDTEFNSLLIEIKKTKTIKQIKQMKKIKKISIICISGIAALAIFLILLINVFIPNNRYNNAVELIKNGNYQAAQIILEDLKGFKDSEEQLKYLSVYKYCQNGFYDTAIASFKQLGGIADIEYNTDGGVIDEKSLKAVKKGYNFVDWVLEECFVDRIDKVLSIKLKAIYEIISYKINYLWNDGNFDNEPIYDYTVNDSVKLPIICKQGYDFIGWTNTQGDIIDSIVEGTVGDIYLSASFTPKKYFITYDSNGGNYIDRQQVYYDQHIKFITPTKTGYIFSNWLYNGQVFDKTKFDILEDITLVAEWKINIYSITFDSNGGTYVQKQNIQYYGFADEPDDPVRTGYTFVGWQLNGFYYNFSEPIEQSITLIAIWKINTYNISYELNSSTNNVNNKLTYTVVDSLQFEDPYKKGYTFNGWYTDYQFTNKITSISKGQTGDIKLYAKFTANTYTVSVQRESFIVYFDLNGGTSSAISPQIVTIETGLIYPVIPTRTGYCFKGWYTTSECTSLFDFTQLVTTNITLYAGWESVSGSRQVDGRFFNGNLSDAGNICFPVLSTGKISISFYVDTRYERSVTIKNVTKNCTLLNGSFNWFSTPKTLNIDANAGDVIQITSSSLFIIADGYLRIENIITPSSGGKAIDTFKEMDVSFDSTFDIPVRSIIGYSFVGYFDANNNQVTNFEGLSINSYNYENDIILHEVWEKVE